MIGTEQASSQLQSREERIVLGGRAMVPDAGCRINKREDKQAERLTGACLITGSSYRGQNTSPDSCSNKGNFNFNWKLTMAPEPAVDCAIILELLHLKEMNHTKRFWGLVDKRCPRWREHKKWLNDHGVELGSRLSA
jgi:hypothetical protein